MSAHWPVNHNNVGSQARVDFGGANQPKKLGKRSHLRIIDCDYHPGFQQIAFVDTDTGELQERRLAELNFELWIGGAAEIRNKRVRLMRVFRAEGDLGDVNYDFPANPPSVHRCRWVRNRCGLCTSTPAGAHRIGLTQTLNPEMGWTDCRILK
jgi:hypothetical protein